MSVTPNINDRYGVFIGERCHILSYLSPTSNNYKSLSIISVLAVCKKQNKIILQAEIEHNPNVFELQCFKINTQIKESNHKTYKQLNGNINNGTCFSLF